jgi:excisionase family DNA binding protein
MSKKPPAETPLYVRLPPQVIDKIDRAAEALGVHKKELVAGLVSRYVDPDNHRSLSELGSMSTPRRALMDRANTGATLGAYSFSAYDPPEVMSTEQAGQFLQIDEPTILAIAEAGDLPGRKLGAAWRFSRTALLAWLAAPQGRP